MRIKKILTFYGIAALALVCLAQVRMEANDMSSLRLMSWSGNLNDLWLRDGSEYIQTNANEFILGRPIAVNELDSTLRFFREIEIEGALRKIPAAEVSLPQDTNSVLIVLAPTPAGSELPLQGQALDQSLEAHPLNTMRLVNFSSRTLAMRVADETQVIAPKGEWIVPFPDAGPPQLAMAVAVNDAEEGWVLVQSSLQATPRGRRVLGLIRDGRPDMGIQDPEMRTKLVDAIFIVDRYAPRPKPID